MKNSKLLIFISLFNLALLVSQLAGFSDAGDKSAAIGYNAKLLERDTNLVLIYGGDTVRWTITRAGNNFILGSSSAQPRGSITAQYFNGPNGVSSFDQLWVHSTVGVSEDFYNEGTSKFAGYAIMDSVYARTLVTPLATITAAAITTLTGTSATYTRVTCGDSLSTRWSIADSYRLRTTAGAPTINKEDAVIYVKGGKLIFKYKDSGGSDYYYYCNLAAGASITELTFSLSEP